MDENTVLSFVNRLLIGILISGSLPRKNPSFQWCVCAEAAVAASAHTHHGRFWGW